MTISNTLTGTGESATRRRPRFKRSPLPPAFRLTDGDVEIIRLLARHRFLRSTHIAALAQRSIDRTNDRLFRLFHSGYLDRPRAQLDYYPSTGSAPMVYALADRGARFLRDTDGKVFASVEWGRKNRRAGRPFLEHQLEIMDFYVAVKSAVRRHGGLRFIDANELVASFADQSACERDPFALSAQTSPQSATLDIKLIPDLVFGLMFPDGSRRCFMVEIDRGTMPISRSDLSKTSFELKMRAYLAAYAAGHHERHFRWKTFRVLTVAKDVRRVRSMIESLRSLHVARSPGAGLFFFTTPAVLREADPLQRVWVDGNGRRAVLI